MFGYITVLPGAFSACSCRRQFLCGRLIVDVDEFAPPDRYIALQNNAQGEGPLKEYFKGETLHHSVDAEWVFRCPNLPPGPAAAAY